MRTATLALLAAVACGEPEASCDVELRPVGDGMPDLEMQVGDTVETDLRDHYGPDGCVDLYADHERDVWAVRSADPSTVAVSVPVPEAVLVTVALAVADSVRVTVELTDANEAWEDDPPHEFLVTVRPR